MNTSSGPEDLGPASGTATSDQGVTKTAIENPGAATAPEDTRLVTIPSPDQVEATRLVTITSPDQDRDSLSEPPNESSLLDLHQPTRTKAKFPSSNHLRLVIVVGLMILLLVSMLVGSPYTNEFIILLGTVVVFYFAKDTFSKA